MKSARQVLSQLIVDLRRKNQGNQATTDQTDDESEDSEREKEEKEDERRNLSWWPKINLSEECVDLETSLLQFLES